MIANIQTILKLYIFSMLIFSCCTGKDEEIILNDSNFNNIPLPPYVNDQKLNFINGNDTLNVLFKVFEEKNPLPNDLRICTKRFYLKKNYVVIINGYKELTIYINSEQNTTDLILENRILLNEKKIEINNITVQDFFLNININGKNYTNVYYCLLEKNINREIFYTKEQGIICFVRNNKIYYLN